MMRQTVSAGRVLVVRAGAQLVALPLQTVGETMRPLPTDRVAGMPPFVLGVTVVHGEPVPVTDLGLLVSGERSSIGRYVTIRSGSGTFMLGVGEVLGIQELPVDNLRELPGLLGREASSVALGLASRDQRLVILLETARLVPDQVWSLVRSNAAAQ
jgi:purine-binding chemotaxis protein CheW